MGTVNELLTLARKQLSVREDPAGSNNVRYNTWYYGREVHGSGYPWCMVFVQWCFAQLGIPLPKRTASCGDLMRAAQTAGCWIASNFQPGDVVIYDFSGQKRTTEHCGIVESAAYREVVAIEGNTGAGNDANGGQVQRRTRAKKYIIGAVRPQFDVEKKEEDTMTGKEIYNALNDYLSKQPVPNWAKAELEEAKKMGITDGSNPMQLIPKYQAVLLAKRAAERK